MSEKVLLSDLIAKLERATASDRALDSSIKLGFAACLFAAGATKGDAVRILGGDLYADPMPYTSSLDAALTLVPEGHGWILDFMDPYEPDAAVGSQVCSRDHGDPEPKNPALMLCVAAMKARANQ